MEVALIRAEDFFVGSERAGVEELHLGVADVAQAWERAGCGAGREDTGGDGPTDRTAVKLEGFGFLGDGVGAAAWGESDWSSGREEASDKRELARF
jgi:hypothetical protein